MMSLLMVALAGSMRGEGDASLPHPELDDPMYLIEPTAEFWADFFDQSSPAQLFYLVSDEGRERYRPNLSRRLYVVARLYERHRPHLTNTQRDLVALRVLTTVATEVNRTRGKTSILIPIIPLRHPLIYRYAESLLEDETLHSFVKDTARHIVEVDSPE